MSFSTDGEHTIFWRCCLLAVCTIAHLLDNGEVVALTKGALQEKGGSLAQQSAMGNDSDAVPQHISLVHVMGGQHDGAACR